MDRILWIGPRRGPPALQAMLAAQGTELVACPDVDSALKGDPGNVSSVAVFVADWVHASAQIERLLTARPDVQVFLATDAGLPRGVVQCFARGAAGVLEFRSQSRQEILAQLQEGIARHRQTARERELLVRLHGLNEDFLRNVMSATKRNLELEELLAQEQQAALEEDGHTRILIVDDEDVVRQVLERLLSKRGYAHESVSDGEAAVALLRKHRFQLVMTDKNLPGMTGLDVLRQMRRLSPDTDLILMTGYASMDSAIEAINLGAAGYLEKPFDHIDKVIEKIEAVLAKQRERLRKRTYLHQLKDRNQHFLEQYRLIRTDLERCLQGRGVTLKPSPP